MLLAVDHKNDTITTVMKKYALALERSADEASQVLATYHGKTIPSAKQRGSSASAQTFGGGAFPPIVKAATERGKALCVAIAAAKFPNMKQADIKVPIPLIR